MDKVFDTLVDQWMYDISVLSQGWVIWSVLPAMIYLVFMMLKWLTLTIPVWLPVAIIVKAFKE